MYKRSDGVLFSSSFFFFSRFGDSRIFFPSQSVLFFFPFHPVIIIIIEPIPKLNMTTHGRNVFCTECKLTKRGALLFSIHSLKENSSFIVRLISSMIIVPSERNFAFFWVQFVRVFFLTAQLDTHIYTARANQASSRCLYPSLRRTSNQSYVGKDVKSKRQKQALVQTSGKFLATLRHQGETVREGVDGVGKGEEWIVILSCRHPLLDTKKEGQKGQPGETACRSVTK